MEDWNDNLLELVQEDVWARLSNDAFFIDVPVLLQRNGNIESDVETALSSANEKTGKYGVCVCVLMPELANPEGESPGPVVSLIQSFQVIERKLFNEDPDTGTGKSAERVALNVLNLLHRYIPFHIGHVMMADNKPVRPQSATSGEVIYLTVLKMQTGLSRVAKVINPTVEHGAGTITLSTATPGAELYYTEDGSYPGPSNDSAMLYTVPFFPAATPELLRVAGYKQDLIPSDTVCADIV